MLHSVLPVRKTTAAPAYDEHAASGLYLAGSILSMAAALTFKHLGRKQPLFYIGQWIAPLLIMKIVGSMAKNKR